MSLLGIDLGETKMVIAVMNTHGDILHKETLMLEGRDGKQVGALITYVVSVVLKTDRFAADPVNSIGISMPILTDSSLLTEIKVVAGNVPVVIESHRNCYLQGEIWKGNARGCRDAIYLFVGTRISAGILSDGKILRGSQDMAGAVGWMALNKPYVKEFSTTGNFEYFASGKGIARLAQEILKEVKTYNGQLRNKNIEDITVHDVFVAFENDDEIALNVMSVCVEYWGMAIANLVSIFNPVKIILGGEVFGPAISLISEIKAEASRWAGPLNMQQVNIVASHLGADGGIYGAAYLALQSIQ